MLGGSRGRGADGGAGPSSPGRPHRRVALVFQPAVLIPLALSVSTLAAVVAFGDPQRVVSLVGAFRPAWLAAAGAALLCYQVVRAAQWLVLLHALGVRAGWRRSLLAYLLGEAARNAPGGVLLQDYVVSRTGVASFGRAAAATFAMLATEIALALAGALVLGVQGWPWLRPGTLILVASAAAAAAALRRMAPHAAAPRGRWGSLPPPLWRLVHRLRQVLGGARPLARVPVLAATTAMGAGCLLAAALALQAVLRGLGATPAFDKTLAAYLVGVAVYLLVPVPLDVGGPEVAGVAALLAVGVDKSVAVSALVLSRACGLVVSMAGAAAGALVLRAELRGVLHRPAAGTGNAGPAS